MTPNAPELTQRWPAPREIPVDLRRGKRRDSILRILDVLVSTQIKLAVLIHRDEPPENRIDEYKTTLTVSERTTVASDNDVVSIELRAPDGSDLERWHPGAHLDLYLPSGRIRQYSLCGDPADRRCYRIAVRRIPDGGGGSNEVHDELPVGTVVGVRGPRNAFGFVEPGRIERAKRVHFVAGGIGITPILPMIREAERMGLDWSLVYVGRERRTLPFLAELSPFGDRVTIRTDDEYGLPTATDLLPPNVRSGDAIYCCGPVPMMDLITAGARNQPGVEVHAERFSATPVVDGRPFRIQLARTGQVIDVAADQTALDAVLRVNPKAPYSCRQGFCGTCMVHVIDGDVDHRDNSLSPAERAEGKMLLCVSRSNSPCLTVTT